MVRLGNVNNTADASKPVSTAMGEALATKQTALSSSTDVTVRDLTASTCTFSLIQYTGTSGKTVNNNRGIYIGLDSANVGGIEIFADLIQYVDFATPNVDYQGRM